MTGPLDAQFVVFVRQQLPGAMRARDSVRVAVLRAVVAAIDNAGAPPEHRPDRHAAAPEPHVGLGAAEVPRQELTLDGLRQVVAGIRSEHVAMASHLSSLGREDDAVDELRAIELLDDLRRDRDEMFEP